MLHIIGSVFFIAGLFTALAIMANAIIRDRDAITHALGWAPGTLLPQLPAATQRNAMVRVVKRVRSPALRLAA